MTLKDAYDFVVIGSGHAGSCAALSAVQNGCKSVAVLEKAPQEWRGGNGYFTVSFLGQLNLCVDSN